MFRRNLFPLWSAMIVLASMYLMGQGWSPDGGAPAPVAKTGQTISYAQGDDGDWQKGLASPVPRFTDNLDGTVTDSLTGLIWVKDAGCSGAAQWADALVSCNNLAAGQCGLEDGSLPGDWRLPNVKELSSLIDYGNHSPALPTGHPFINSGGGPYWSSTTTSPPPQAWFVYYSYGIVHYEGKGWSYYVWCVRGGVG